MCKRFPIDTLFRKSFSFNYPIYASVCTGKCKRFPLENILGKRFPWKSAIVFLFRMKRVTWESVFLENRKSFSCIILGRKSFSSSGTEEDISGKRLHGLWESVFINWYDLCIKNFFMNKYVCINIQPESGKTTKNSHLCWISIQNREYLQKFDKKFFPFLRKETFLSVFTAIKSVYLCKRM